MPDEQTNPIDTTGATADTPVENTDEPTSLYGKTKAIVTRQEAANKKTEELLKRQETLYANQRLAGTAGGNVEVKPTAPTDEEIAEKFDKGEVDILK